jgi:hypothetical protein
MSVYSHGSGPDFWHWAYRAYLGYKRLWTKSNKYDGSSRRSLYCCWPRLGDRMSKTRYQQRDTTLLRIQTT